MEIKFTTILSHPTLPTGEYTFIEELLPYVLAAYLRQELDPSLEDETDPEFINSQWQITMGFHQDESELDAYPASYNAVEDFDLDLLIQNTQKQLANLIRVRELNERLSDDS